MKSDLTKSVLSQKSNISGYKKNSDDIILSESSPIKVNNINPNLLANKNLHKTPLTVSNKSSSNIDKTKINYQNQQHSVSAGLKPKTQIMQTSGASDYTQEAKIHSKLESIDLEGGAKSGTKITSSIPPSRVQSSNQKWKSSG